MPRASQVQKGRINRQRYSAYVAELEATGRKFPVNQFGNVNLTLIAEACGFRRQVFSTNKNMRERLEKDIFRIGTETSQDMGVDTLLAKKASDKTKEASQLRKELDAKTQEIAVLRSELESVKKLVRELAVRNTEADSIFTEMVTTGRRFSL